MGKMKNKKTERIYLLSRFWVFGKQIGYEDALGILPRNEHRQTEGVASPCYLPHPPQILFPPLRRVECNTCGHGWRPNHHTRDIWHIRTYDVGL